MMTSCPYLKRLAPAFCVFLTLWAAAAGAGDTDLRARRILDAAGVQGGLVVHLGCGDGTATAGRDYVATNGTLLTPDVARLLTRKTEDPEWLKFLNMMTSEAERIEEILQDLFDRFDLFVKSWIGKIDQMQKQVSPLNMAQKTGPQTMAIAGPLDQTGDVGDDKAT